MLSGSKKWIVAVPGAKWHDTLVPKVKRDLDATDLTNEERVAAEGMLRAAGFGSQVYRDAEGVVICQMEDADG